MVTTMVARMGSCLDILTMMEPKMGIGMGSCLEIMTMMEPQMETDSYSDMMRMMEP